MLCAHDVAVGQDGWAAEVLKANAVDLFRAVRVDKDADVSKALKEVQLVCRYAPETVNNRSSVLLVNTQSHTESAVVVGQNWITPLHWLTHCRAKQGEEMAKLLLKAKASVDAKTKVKAGCS